MLEICVDSILSAEAASQGGADRIELCSALSEGGLTPSLGLFHGVKKALENSSTKIFCMIRIRRGDFNFSDDEIDAMIKDVEYFKSQQADGIVIGCLDSEKNIQVENCKKLISAWGNPENVTFHRAFDETNRENAEKNLIILSSMGIRRILTSGFESSAEKGIENLKTLFEDGKKLEISIMPGAGISESNALKILTETGCKELHASARSPLANTTSTKISMGGGEGDLLPLMVCDKEKVKNLKAAVESFK